MKAYTQRSIRISYDIIVYLLNVNRAYSDIHLKWDAIKAWKIDAIMHS
jgi:hypothetical protein